MLDRYVIEDEIILKATRLMREWADVKGSEPALIAAADALSAMTYNNQSVCDQLESGNTRYH